MTPVWPHGLQYVHRVGDMRRPFVPTIALRAIVRAAPSFGKPRCILPDGPLTDDFAQPLAALSPHRFFAGVFPVPADGMQCGGSGVAGFGSDPAGLRVLPDRRSESADAGAHRGGPDADGWRQV